jgi:hypothetical protein
MHVPLAKARAAVFSRRLRPATSVLSASVRCSLAKAS